jgi:hypothetical protein
MTSLTKYHREKISPFFNSLLKATILSVSLAIVLPVPVLVAQTGTNNPANLPNSQPTNPVVPPNNPSPNGFPTYQINPNVSPNSVNNPNPPNPNGFPTYQINPNNPNVSPNSVNNPNPTNGVGKP